MDYLNPDLRLELVCDHGDRVEVVKYVEADPNGLITVERLAYNERERIFEPVGFGDARFNLRLVVGLRERLLRPVPPLGLSHPTEIISGQQIEVRQPFGYAVCTVETVLDNGTFRVQHRDGSIQTVHRRDLRKNLKYRRHPKDWVDHSFSR